MMDKQTSMWQEVDKLTSKLAEVNAKIASQSKIPNKSLP